MNTNALIDRLMQTVSLFRGFSHVDVQEFIGRAKRLDCVKGQTVIREREPGTTLFVVIAGNLEVLRTTADQQEVRIAVLGPGNTFGEMGLIEHLPRSASVRCISDCCLLMLDEKDLLHIPEVCPKLYRNLACMLAERLRNSNTSISLMLSDKPAAPAQAMDPFAPKGPRRRVRYIG